MFIRFSVAVYIITERPIFFLLLNKGFVTCLMQTKQHLIYGKVKIYLCFDLFQTLICKTRRERVRLIMLLDANKNSLNYGHFDRSLNCD